MAEAGNQKVIIDISSLTLIKILLITVALFFLFYIRGVVLLLFVALILASAFDPWVDWLQKNKVPRAVAILLIYLALFSILGGAVYLIIPPIAIEVTQLSKDFPFYWEKVMSGIYFVRDYSNEQGLNQGIQDSLTALQNNISAAAGGVFSTIFSLFGGIISFFVILVIAFYLTVEEQAMKRLLRSLVPVKYQPYFTHLVNRMQEMIGRWLRGQLALSFIIFFACWIGLTILGVKYALVLALFAGVMEIVPYLGPFMGGIPAVFIAFTQSPLLAFWTIILYVIIQQLENNIIVPKVMQRAVGLNPIIVIVVILIGAKIAGILGVLLAVPVTTALSVWVNDLLEIKKEV